MENLEIDPTNNTPHVILDAGNGRIYLSGRSIPEDADVFYCKIFNWIDQYYGETSGETEIEFKLEYINSGSSKYILELLREALRLTGDNRITRVIWCFERDDESIEELGEHYDTTIDLPFEFREYEDEDEDYD
ncbi:hypothetical protein ES705_28851 [subsurface metagenome]